TRLAPGPPRRELTPQRFDDQGDPRRQKAEQEDGQQGSRERNRGVGTEMESGAQQLPIVLGEVVGEEDGRERGEYAEKRSQPHRVDRGAECRASGFGQETLLEQLLTGDAEL